jgi:hypothetical protein
MPYEEPKLAAITVAARDLLPARRWRVPRLVPGTKGRHPEGSNGPADRAMIQTCYSCGMATPEFILQGFTASTHIDALQRLFDLPDIQTVLVSVAFVTEGGVEQIEAHVIEHAARARRAGMMLRCGK